LSDRDVSGVRKRFRACQHDIGLGVLVAAFLLLSTVARAESITLAWDPSQGAGGYVLHYGTASGVYTFSVDVGSQTTYTVGGLAAGTHYYFAVDAYSIFGTSDLSNEVTGLPGFTDGTLTSGTTIIRAVHILELRQHIDALRAQQGLPAWNWADPVLNSTLIRAVHILELRSALAEVYQRLGLAVPVYADNNLAVGATFVKAVHITQLRQAVSAIE